MFLFFTFVTQVVKTPTNHIVCHYLHFLLACTRCNIYISRLCYDVSVRLSVRLSVTEVHWRIIANLGFKFRSKLTVYCGRGEG